MASFLRGPAAQLVGAGMQAIGVGIPVGESSAKVIDGLRECGLPVPPKTWFKRKDGGKEQPQQSRSMYDKLEAHINGVMQVVKPAIELKKLVRGNYCKSAERRRRASCQPPEGPEGPDDSLRYYTPQKCSSGACLSASPKRKAPTKLSKCERRRQTVKRQDSSSDEEEHCLYCSRTRSLLKLPCGRLICTKCHQTADHTPECKKCRAAEKSCAYGYCL